eukprot:TRINITY_DN3470_c0_g1_i7.p1 TRINITY_DN3470_c0_g1~~TRINITY_DN3470_c0_g1_i7.p1  ORF type:complete len:2745 (-),score=479.39 TRINITY_DN3470_c0_g1_i7:74-8308(-)
MAGPPPPAGAPLAPPGGPAPKAPLAPLVAAAKTPLAPISAVKTPASPPSGQPVLAGVRPPTASAAATPASSVKAPVSPPGQPGAPPPAIMKPPGAPPGQPLLAAVKAPVAAPVAAALPAGVKPPASPPAALLPAGVQASTSALSAATPAGVKALPSAPAAPLPAGIKAPSSPPAPLPAGVKAPGSPPGAPLPAGVKAPSSPPGAPLLAGVKAPSSPPGAPLLAAVKAPSSPPGAPLLAGVKAPSSPPGAPLPAGVKAPSSPPGAPLPAGVKAPSSPPGAPLPAGVKAPSSPPGAPLPAGVKASSSQPGAPLPAGVKAPASPPSAPQLGNVIAPVVGKAVASAPVSAAPLAPLAPIATPAASPTAVNAAHSATTATPPSPPAPSKAAPAGIAAAGAASQPPTALSPATPAAVVTQPNPPQPSGVLAAPKAAPSPGARAILTAPASASPAPATPPAPAMPPGGGTPISPAVATAPGRPPAPPSAPAAPPAHFASASPAASGQVTAPPTPPVVAVTPSAAPPAAPSSAPSTASPASPKVLQPIGTLAPAASASGSPPVTTVPAATAPAVPAPAPAAPPAPAPAASAPAAPPPPSLGAPPLPGVAKSLAAPSSPTIATHAIAAPPPAAPASAPTASAAPAPSPPGTRATTAPSPAAPPPTAPAPATPGPLSPTHSAPASAASAMPPTVNSLVGAPPLPGVAKSLAPPSSPTTATQAVAAPPSAAPAYAPVSATPAAPTAGVAGTTTALSSPAPPAMATASGAPSAASPPSPPAGPGDPPPLPAAPVPPESAQPPADDAPLGALTKLKITMTQATGLRAMNFLGDSMCCQCTVMQRDKKAKPIKCETKALGKTLNPIWNETHELDWNIGLPIELAVLGKGTFQTSHQGKPIVMPSEQFYPAGFSSDLAIPGLDQATLRVQIQIGACSLDGDWERKSASDITIEGLSLRVDGATHTIAHIGATDFKVDSGLNGGTATYTGTSITFKNGATYTKKKPPPLPQKPPPQDPPTAGEPSPPTAPAETPAPGAPTAPSTASPPAQPAPPFQPAPVASGVPQATAQAGAALSEAERQQQQLALQQSQLWLESQIQQQQLAQQQQTAQKQQVQQLLLDHKQQRQLHQQQQTLANLLRSRPGRNMASPDWQPRHDWLCIDDPDPAAPLPPAEHLAVGEKAFLLQVDSIGELDIPIAFVKKKDSERRRAQDLRRLVELEASEALIFHTRQSFVFTPLGGPTEAYGSSIIGPKFVPLPGQLQCTLQSNNLKGSLKVSLAAPKKTPQQITFHSRSLGPNLQLVVEVLVAEEPVKVNELQGSTMTVREWHIDREAWEKMHPTAKPLPNAAAKPKAKAQSKAMPTPRERVLGKTKLSSSAEPGATQLELDDCTGFLVGDTVTLSAKVVRLVAGLGTGSAGKGMSVMLDRPLPNDFRMRKGGPVEVADLEPVTKYSAQIGRRVHRRSADWTWGDQDGGPWKLGTLAALYCPDLGPGWVEVLWDGATETNAYRVGAEGKFDLEYAGEKALSGVGQLTAKQIESKELEVQEIKGLVSRPANPLLLGWCMLRFDNIAETSRTMFKHRLRPDSLRYHLLRLHDADSALPTSLGDEKRYTELLTFMKKTADKNVGAVNVEIHVANAKLQDISNRQRLISQPELAARRSDQLKIDLFLPRGEALRAMSYEKLGAEAAAEKAASSSPGDTGLTIGLPRTCAVCLDEFTEQAECAVLPCGHVFHAVCAQKFLAEAVPGVAVPDFEQPAPPPVPVAAPLPGSVPPAAVPPASPVGGSALHVPPPGSPYGAPPVVPSGPPAAVAPMSPPRVPPGAPVSGLAPPSSAIAAPAPLAKAVAAPSIGPAVRSPVHQPAIGPLPPALASPKAAVLPPELQTVVERVYMRDQGTQSDPPPILNEDDHVIGDGSSPSIYTLSQMKGPYTGPTMKPLADGDKAQLIQNLGDSQAGRLLRGLKPAHEGAMRQPRRELRWRYEEEDVFQADIINLEFLAQRTIFGSNGERIFFQLRFFVFPQARTNASLLAGGPGEACLLRSSITNERVGLLYTVDGAARQHSASMPGGLAGAAEVHRQLVEYMSARDAEIEVWNADAQMLVGLVCIPMEQLVRQGHPVAKLETELPVVDPLSGDARGFLKVLMECRGRQAKEIALPPPPPPEEKMAELLGVAPPSDGEGAPKDGKGRVRHRARMLLAPNAGPSLAAGLSGDDMQEAGKKRDRIKLLRQMRRVDVEDQFSDRTALLSAAEEVRHDRKKEEVARRMDKFNTSQMTVLAEFGTSAVFHIEFTNPYSRPAAFGVTIAETGGSQAVYMPTGAPSPPPLRGILPAAPEIPLHAVTDAEEWRRLVGMRRVPPPPGGDYAMLQGHGLFNLSAGGTVCLPFRYLGFHHPALEDFSAQVAPAAGLTLAEIVNAASIPGKDRCFTVQVVLQQGPVMKRVELTTRMQPCVVDRTVRFYEAEGTPMEKSVALPVRPSTALINRSSHVPPFPEGPQPPGAQPPAPPPPVGIATEQMFIYCTDRDVHLQRRDENELMLRMLVPQAPQKRFFCLITYGDRYFHQATSVQLVEVHALRRENLSVTVGMSVDRSICLPPAEILDAQAVKLYSSEPETVAVQSSADVDPRFGAKFTVTVTALRSGTRTCRLHAVDPSSRKCLAAFLLVIAVDMPEVRMVHEISLPVLTTLIKRLPYKNEATRPLRYVVRSSNPAIMTVRTPDILLPARETCYVELLFHACPATLTYSTEVLLFVASDDRAIQETRLLRLTYT